MLRPTGALLLIVASGCASHPAPPAHPLDLQATCPTAYLPLDAATCQEIRPEGYGLSAARPLLWGDAGSSQLWYGRLKCADGQTPQVVPLRRGEVGPSSDAPASPISHVRGDSDILELWSVACGDRVETWYVDISRCGNPCPPEGTALIGVSAFELFQSSMVLAQQGQRVGAIGAVRRAVELDPETEGLWGWLGNLELAEGRYEDALSSLERASGFDPGDTNLQLQRSIALFETERYSEYLTLLDAVLGAIPANDPRAPELLCRRGIALTALDQTEEGMMWAARSCAMGFWPCCEAAR